MYFVCKLFIFNNMAQIRNKELLRLSYEDMYFNRSFITLTENIFTICSRNRTVNVNKKFICKNQIIIITSSNPRNVIIIWFSMINLQDYIIENLLNRS